MKRYLKNQNLFNYYFLSHNTFFLNNNPPSIDMKDLISNHQEFQTNNNDDPSAYDSTVNNQMMDQLLFVIMHKEGNDSKRNALQQIKKHHLPLFVSQIFYRMALIKNDTIKFFRFNMQFCEIFCVLYLLISLLDIGPNGIKFISQQLCNFKSDLIELESNLLSVKAKDPILQVLTLFWQILTIAKVNSTNSERFIQCINKFILHTFSPSLPEPIQKSKNIGTYRLRLFFTMACKVFSSNYSIDQNLVELFVNQNVYISRKMEGTLQLFRNTKCIGFHPTCEVYILFLDTNQDQCGECDNCSKKCVCHCQLCSKSLCFDCFPNEFSFIELVVSEPMEMDMDINVGFSNDPMDIDIFVVQ